VQVRFLSALLSKQSIQAERNLLGLFSFLHGISKGSGGHFDFCIPNDSIRFGCLDLGFGALTPSQMLPASQKAFGCNERSGGSPIDSSAAGSGRSTQSSYA
jgi:hypothetical protein